MSRSKGYGKLALVGGAVALIVAVVLPVFGDENPNADHLRLTEYDDGSFEDYFGMFYGGTDPSSATDPQPFGFDRGCLITGINGPVATIASSTTHGAKGPGIHNLSLGVKSGGSNGTPCSESSHPEILKISADDNQVWNELRLDVQPKGNAWVLVHLQLLGGGVETHQLLTGGSIAAYNLSVDSSLAETIRDTSLPYEATTGVVQGTDDPDIEACANPSDSGPDSGINDNCIWHVVAGASFNGVQITTKSGWGSVALEGGGDFEGVEASGFDGDSFDTLFYRALSAANDSGDGYTIPEDTALSIAAPGVMANDSGVGSSTDAVLDSGTVAYSSGTNSDDPDGSDVLSLSPDGSLSYTPQLDWHGTVTFDYHLETGGSSSNSATVTIVVTPVNDPPEALSGPLVAVEDQESQYDVNDLATDPDGDDLEFTSVETGNPQATATINEDGTITYFNPESNSCVNDALTFTVSDGTLSDTETVTINITCAPDDDSYEMDDLEHEFPFDSAVLVESAPGVLANDGPVLNVVPSGGTTAAGATYSVAADGSFTYDPDDDYSWGPDEFSYVDSWTYDVDDEAFPDPLTVTVTVYRVICSGQFVTDVDGGIKGEFTLLSASDICKRYEVEAYQGSDPDTDPSTITFSPTPNGGPVEMFRGALTFDPIPSMDGSIFVGLTYDPDNDGPLGDRDLLPCIAPLFGDGFPLVTSATLPVGETWCLAAGTFVASGNGLAFVPTAHTYGEEDPKFSFK